MSERREDPLIHLRQIPGHVAWLLAGLLWLWLGMVWMPAGPSLNPGHAYNLLVALLLYVPVLIWLVRGFRAWPRYLRQSSTLRLSLLLMGWALLSLCWSNVDHRGQEAGRILSVLSLIVAWLVCFGRHRERTIEFLDIGAAALALSALMLIGMAWSAGHGLDRLAAIGVLGNANSAGAVMGAACLWLMGGGSRASPRYAWRWVAVTILWVFVLLSQSRSTLAGWLAVAMLTGLTYYRHRLTPRRFVILGGLLVTGALLVYLLGQRGMSLRPQIAARTLQMIAAGSWHGQGQGSHFLVYAGRQTLTHTHNLFTQTLLQLGWPGLLLLVALLLSALRTGLRWRHQPEGRMLLQTGLYGLVVTQFDLPVLLDSPHPVWILLWLPLAQAVLLETCGGFVAPAGRGLSACRKTGIVNRSLNGREQAAGSSRRGSGGECMSEQTLGISVVVTNYNYAAFVTQAVDAALAQSHPPLEIVVVDDGSTDDSVSLLRERYAGHSKIILLAQANGGQLQAFKAGMARVRGDVVCFLDADDYWDEGYLAKLAALYAARPDVDFVFSDMQLSGRVQERIAFAAGPVDLGYTAIATWQEAVWYGAPTSGLSLRTTLARRCLDLPASFDPVWRLAADNCLVFGASLLGGRKYYLPTGDVHYRVHSEHNWWFTQARERQFLHTYRSRCLINHYAAIMHMDGLTLRLAKAEFKSRVDPDWQETRRYLRLIWSSDDPLRRRLERCTGMIGGYLRGRRQRLRGTAKA